MSVLTHQIPFDWRMKALLDGRAFHVDIGAFSTPLLGGGNGTIIDQDQPEGVISVPLGTTIMPFRIAAQAKLPMIAADSNEAEILVAVDILAVHVPHATAPATETALKMFLGHGTSKCSCYSASTANATNPTLGMELARAHTAAEVTAGAANTFWSELGLLYNPKVLPVLVGPCALYVYWGGTVGTSGFAQIEWFEYLTSEL